MKFNFTNFHQHEDSDYGFDTYEGFFKKKNKNLKNIQES